MKIYFSVFWRRYKHEHLFSLSIYLFVSFVISWCIYIHIHKLSLSLSFLLCLSLSLSSLTYSFPFRLSLSLSPSLFLSLSFSLSLSHSLYLYISLYIFSYFLTPCPSQHLFFFKYSQILIPKQNLPIEMKLRRTGDWFYTMIPYIRYSKSVKS